MNAGQQLLTVGQIAQRTGTYESRIRRLLKTHPTLVVLAGRSRCIDVESLPAVNQILSQTPAALPGVQTGSDNARGV